MDVVSNSTVQSVQRKQSFTLLHDHHRSLNNFTEGGFWLYYLNVETEIRTWDTSNVLLSNFSRPVCIVSLVPCCLLTGEVPSVVFSYCHQHVSRFNKFLCTWLNQTVICLCCFWTNMKQSAYSVNSEINKVFTQLLLTGYFLFSRLLSINPWFFERLISYWSTRIFTNTSVWHQ